MRRSKARNLYLFSLSVFFIFGCAQRHSQIPRVHSFGKKSQSSFHSGHYVSEKNKLKTLKSTHKKQEAVSKHTNEQFKVEKPTVTPDQELEPIFPTKPSSGIFTTSIDSVQSSDTISPYDIDQSLIKGSGIMFAIATGMNAALLITPVYNFLFIGLLVGLALLIVGYFISKFVENAKQNRTRPLKYKFKNYTKRAQVKKAFNILMIISGSSFSIALMTAASGSFSAPIFFFAVGLIALWGGLLVGLSYLIMGI